MRRLPLLLIFLAMPNIATAKPSLPAKPYMLPPDRTIALPPGQDAEITAATCAACHSLDYLVNQPRGKGAQFWKDEVAKMVGTYGAPVEQADADKITSYLGRAFGK